MFKAKKLQATLVAVTAVVGLAVSTPSAQASTCHGNGGAYICEYGVSQSVLFDGTVQEFVVGTDHAVWTNWHRPNGSWNGWVSLGGWVQSRISVEPRQERSTSPITVSAIGADGKSWFRMRNSDGTWTNWYMNCIDNPNGKLCP
ncbi:hypothetical protein ABZZ17_35910 [Streptomyces sp. NPDC006512]|uniref:hypothetical protein n=1 Tax=Streptomyces sp. NPDC006512 TaxID=3154307 RepID=UPI00339FA006